MSDWFMTLSVVPGTTQELNKPVKDQQSFSLNTGMMENAKASIGGHCAICTITQHRLSAMVRKTLQQAQLHKVGKPRASRWCHDLSPGSDNKSKH